MQVGQAVQIIQQHARIGHFGHPIEHMLDMQTDQTALTAAFGCHIVQTEADDLLTGAMVTAAPAEQRAVSQARALLRVESNTLRKRMESYFVEYLERAMQTMHTDLRAGLHDINADNLT